MKTLFILSIGGGWASPAIYDKYDVLGVSKKWYSISHKFIINKYIIGIYIHSKNIV